MTRKIVGRTSRCHHRKSTCKVTAKARVEVTAKARLEVIIHAETSGPPPKNAPATANKLYHDTAGDPPLPCPAAHDPHYVKQTTKHNNVKHRTPTPIPPS